ncbi:MAG: cell division protein CrgA [Actinobacteria bacterium]|nr:cell division protein CrgA [Actinomycetota bacterium]
MSAKSKTGPGSAQRKGKSKEGRAAAAGGGSKRGASKVGRYKSPEETGRYTPPIPKSVRKSPRWYGPVMLAVLILGVLMILSNYLVGLPGAPHGSPWYLVSGLGILFVGSIMATRYH